MSHIIREYAGKEMKYFFNVSPLKIMDILLSLFLVFSLYTYFIYFQSSGGKSGASFYKTTDGRFLLKQINKHEIDTFKSIAHKYFEYITSNDHRALMAKIVGLYTVGYKTINGGARRLDLVVMENLFHGHKIAESFDLKGSMRNRLVDPSGNNVQVK